MATDPQSGSGYHGRQPEPLFFYVQDYVQDERYIAIEHTDVRRDCVNFAQPIN